jgi:hypothetical protein
MLPMFQEQSLTEYPQEAQEILLAADMKYHCNERARQGAPQDCPWGVEGERRRLAD